MTLKKSYKKKTKYSREYKFDFSWKYFLPKFIYVEVEREIIKNTFP
jgi:hypothetical protein